MNTVKPVLSEYDHLKVMAEIAMLRDEECRIGKESPSSRRNKDLHVTRQLKHDWEKALRTGKMPEYKKVFKV